MICDLISDLHGNFAELKGGDLLIIAGDLTAHDYIEEYISFIEWLDDQDYKKKIIVAGNHDNELQNHAHQDNYGRFYPSTYLCDSGTEFEGLKIWGSPWTRRFKGMNRHYTAFTCDTDEELAEKWAKIPDDTDILITHGPPYAIFDTVRKYSPFSHERDENCGSISLLAKATSLPKLKLFCFGHIHEGYGIFTPKQLIDFASLGLAGAARCKSFPYIVNASHVNERYEPVNKPIRVIL